MATGYKKDFQDRNRKPELNTLVYGKVPPQAPEVERVILGAMLLEPVKHSTIFEIITEPEVFYVDGHQKIYAAAIRLFKKGSPVDLMTVTIELRAANELEIVGGHHFLNGLVDGVVSSAHVETHCRLVMEKFIMRELIRISGQVINNAYEDSEDVFTLLDFAGASLFDLATRNIKKDYEHIAKASVPVFEEIEDNRLNKVTFTGVTTGYKDLDEITRGFGERQLIIIAARPAVGKTAFILNLIRNAAKEKVPCGLFSLEMGKGELIQRILSAEAEVHLNDIKIPIRMSEEQYTELLKQKTGFNNMPIYMDDSSALTIMEFRTKARRMVEKHGVRMIVLDYLQLMQGDSNKSGNREAEISKISRDLKTTAMELEIPIIALSQLNRTVENRASKRPQLSDLRESGAIEQDADRVFFLFRPTEDVLNSVPQLSELGEQAVILGLAKDRHGPTEDFYFRFKKEIQQFVEHQLTHVSNVNFGQGGTPATGTNAAAFIPDEPINHYKDMSMASKKVMSFDKPETEDNLPF